jgi:Flp pilus assembly pilin Flp
MAAMLEARLSAWLAIRKPRQFFHDGIAPTYSCVSVVLMIDLLIHQVSQLWTDDRGADLIEYGLIGGMIAAAGVALFPTIFDKMGNAFENWGNDVYEEWEPDNPIPPPDPDPAP